jgi:hypothetical protein
VLEQAGAQDLHQVQPGTDRLNARLLRTVLSELVEDDARAGSPYITQDGRFLVPLTGVRNRTPTWSRRPACSPRPPEALRESRDVLATRGNMSSVTVLHVLGQVIDEAPTDETRTVCALAFGLGLTVESALFTIPARTAAPATELDPAAAVPNR